MNLEQQRFNLEAVKTQAQMQLDYWRAYADFQLSQAQTYSMRMKAEQERAKQQAMWLIVKEHRRAFKATRKELKKHRQRQKMLQEFVTNATRLQYAESISPDLLPPSWAGFFALINHSPAVAKAVKGIQVTAAERRGIHFCWPRDAGEICEDPPKNIADAMQLFLWARKRSFIPRSSSPAYFMLLQAIEAAASWWDRQSSITESAIAELMNSLRRLREGENLSFPEAVAQWQRSTDPTA